MNDGFGAVCDDFYINCRLFLKLDMALERETVLHFLDRIRKEYPGLKRLRRRDDGCMVLEEEPDDDGERRWIRLDRDSLRFGVFSPTDLDEVRRFGNLIFTQAPYHLTFSDIDYEHIEIKSRTTSYEVRSGSYEGEPISVLLTTRKYWGIGKSVSLADALGTLFDAADDLATQKVVPNIVNALAAAIASRP